MNDTATIEISAPSPHDALPGLRVKLLLVIVEASIAREKVAVGAMLVATAVAPSAGVFAVTVGAAFTVVNCQLTTVARSEARRVGKEGRSRWAPDHLKKKGALVGNGARFPPSG